MVGNFKSVNITAYVVMQNLLTNEICCGQVKFKIPGFNYNRCIWVWSEVMMCEFCFLFFLEKIYSEISELL